MSPTLHQALDCRPQGEPINEGERDPDDDIDMFFDNDALQRSPGGTFYLDPAWSTGN
jgi:hypothetical protein